MTEAPEPFTVAIPDAVLDDLHERLRRTRWSPTVEAAERWSLGTDPATLRELVTYWDEGFDWRAQERWINTLPQFTAEVDDLTVHFVRAQPDGGPSPRTIVLLHGWPGTFLEMARLVPLLTAAGYQVIVPSLPGFGFSTRPPVTGYGYRAMAGTLHRLLTQHLDIHHFGLHGTDVGASVAGWWAVDHPEAVVGVHTMEPGAPRPSFHPPAAPASPDEEAYLADVARWAATEGAYFQLQGSKPFTLGPGLEDSPVGALAWLTEKYRSWSDCGGELFRRYSPEDLLTIVTLYWVTETLGTSVLAYHESRHHDGVVLPEQRSGVPAGVAISRPLVAAPPRNAPPELVQRLYDVRHWVELPRGGHFASWEEPTLVADSLTTFFNSL